MILQPAGPNTKPDNIVDGWTGSCNIDAFDPACWDLIDRHCRERLPDLAGNRNLLGYFCDNECMYGQPHVDRAWTGRLSDLEKPPDEPTLLQRYLAQPEGKPGGDFAWRWALGRLGHHHR
jgi:hypothetical protein